MADVKITELTALTSLSDTDVVPVVDVGSDATKKITGSNLFDRPSGSDYKINGATVINATGLGSAVVASSLTSVGTITTGTWNGTPIGIDYIADISLNDLTDAKTTDSGAVDESIFIGTDSGSSITNGKSNVAIGYKALEDGEGTDRGVAIGAYAALNAQNDQNFVAIGYEAGQASIDGNVLIGSKAGKNVTGTDNVFIGDQAGKNATGTNRCTFIGNASGQGSNSIDPTGGNNTALGHNTLISLQSGQNNTACGAFSAGNITSGSYNTILGTDSGTAITTGDDNTCLGVNAGDSINTGSENTIVGKDAGTALTSGSNNIIIGYDADTSSGTVSNQIRLGNSNIASFRCNVQTIQALSDARDKTDIQELPEGLAFIDSLNPVKFQWQTRDGNSKDGTYEAGFIAQDLQSAQSEANADYLGLVMDDNPDRLEASYGKLVPMLVKAIQELKSEVEQLKANAAT